MKVEIDLPLDRTSVVARLVVEIPSAHMSARQVSQAFGIPEKTVRADAFAGKLNATTTAGGGWVIPVSAATKCYLGEIIDDAAKACDAIAKSHRKH